jgi:hypothetical protein
MGLDMYLSARKYVSGVIFGEGTEITVNPTYEALSKLAGVGQSLLDAVSFPSGSIELSVGYWRKVNSVHNWFVDNCGEGEDNCKPYYVSRENLETLKNLCTEVLATPENAEELLPTTSGFFFGDTEYGEDYMADIKETYEMLDGILSNPTLADWEYEYRASW